MIIILTLMAIVILGLGLLNLYQARNTMKGAWVFARAKRLVWQAAATNRKSERALAEMDQLRKELKELEDSPKATGEAS